MGETEHPDSLHAREGVERRSLHLDREDAFGARRLDSFRRFAEWGVRGSA
jgi:hypothetical protein